jgi:hypothetical protein
LHGLKPEEPLNYDHWLIWIFFLWTMSSVSSCSSELTNIPKKKVCSC